MLVWLVTTLPLVASVARADDDELKIARSLGREGMGAWAAGDYARADELLSRAIRVHPAPTLFEKRGATRVALGKLLAAASDLRAAAEFTIRADDHPAYQQARRRAEEKLQALMPQIPRLTLKTRGQLTRVTVNGNVWSLPTGTESRALDPGSYVVEVRDTAGHDRSYEVTLALSDHRDVVLEGAPKAPSPVETPGPTPSGVSVSSEGTSAWAYIWSAAAGVLVVATVATGIVALQRRAAFERNNRDDVTLQDKQHLRAVASTWAWVSTALGASAGLAAGTTAYVILVPNEVAGSAHAGGHEWKLAAGMVGRF